MLEQVDIKGFKSFEEVSIDLDQINVMVGPNGAGKSNFISFFRMLNFMLTGSFQAFIGEQGGADELLHYGDKTTAEIEASLMFRSSVGENTYRAELKSAAGDTLIFTREEIVFNDPDSEQPPYEESLGAGHNETNLGEAADGGNETAAFFRGQLAQYRVYQFHDTSKDARLRKKSWADQDGYLRDDAGNLAAILFRLKHENRERYRRIRDTIQQIAPFFDDFHFPVPEQEPEKVQLNWREKGSNYVFSPNQLSDGTLRTMALLTLLLLPEKELPEMIILDEPELGLHPYAIKVVAGLIQEVSNKAQVLMATQSTRLVDAFQPQDILVVERRERSSTFTRPEPEELSEWLESYSLGELWEKNVIGGRP